ncbi:MAG: hypothetical protein GC164_00060 [Phycisphaera sp.]|nr:hypothetical protein [Phycisphaera sp.]
MPRSRARKPVPFNTYIRQRNHRRWSLWLSATVVVAVLAILDRRGAFLYDGGDTHRYDGRSLRVVRVIDGDTLVVDAPDADRRDTHVRLWGIDTPETAKPDRNLPTEPYADDATDMTRSLCEHQTVTLHLEASRIRDKFDRLLAHVELPDHTALAEHLLAAGLARADDRWPHRDLERFALIEQQAKMDGSGLWATDPAPDEKKQPTNPVTP